MVVYTLASVLWELEFQILSKGELAKWIIEINC